MGKQKQDHNQQQQKLEGNEANEQKSCLIIPLKNSFAIIIFLLSVLVRWCVSIYPYSGKSKPPMYGDYEAQRHWMEITFNLNLTDWYINTTDNDLNYWGLDYPPLTAYHSYIMGYIANLINPDFVSLHKSRGIETIEHKLFMRYSVLISDLLIFYPSVFLIANKLFNNNNNRNKKNNDNNNNNGLAELELTKTSETRKPIKGQDSKKSNDEFNLTRSDKNYLLWLFLNLLNPTIILIDHGHFQYNCVSLGLMQLAIYFILFYLPCSSFSTSKKVKTTTTSSSSSYDTNKQRISFLIISSIFFCLALNYKQMELYHSLPFFFYLLGICLESNSFQNGIFKLISIGLAVLLTFTIIWLPFLINGFDLSFQVLNRIFPFARGLFEDKVANFWCSLSVLYKIKEKLNVSTLSKLSLAVTLLANLPSCFSLLFKPRREKFLIAIVNSALLFYLFSFQVHEKSILLATVPACLLINDYPFIVSWFLSISNLSMLPLLYKDGLTGAYISLSLAFITLVCYYYNPIDDKNQISSFLPTLDLTFFSKKISKNQVEKFKNLFQDLIDKAFVLSMIGAVLLSVCFLCIQPPNRLPDLWTVAICVYSCIHFICFSFLFHLIQFTVNSSSKHLSTSSSIGDIDLNLKSCLSCIDLREKSE